MRARVAEDRSAQGDDRARYVGNQSHVDEYIGAQFMRLTIAFLDPAEFGLADYVRNGAAVICARTSARVWRTGLGGVIHLIIPGAQGSEMRSVFWLGEFSLDWPLAGPLFEAVLNTGPGRRTLISNTTAMDLYRHCAEEMNHIPRFLPRLYADIMAAG